MFIGIKRCLAYLWKRSRETARHSETHKSVTFTIDRGNGASDNIKLNKTNSTRFKFKIYLFLIALIAFLCTLSICHFITLKLVERRQHSPHLNSMKLNSWQSVKNWTKLSIAQDFILFSEYSQIWHLATKY